MAELQLFSILVGILLIVLAGRIRQRSLSSRPSHAATHAPHAAVDEPARAERERPRPGLSPIQETQGVGVRLPDSGREERSATPREAE